MSLSRRSWSSARSGTAPDPAMPPGRRDRSIRQEIGRWPGCCRVRSAGSESPRSCPAVRSNGSAGGGHRGEIVGVCGAGGVRLTPFGKPFGAVLADGLQHPEPRGSGPRSWSAGTCRPGRAADRRYPCRRQQVVGADGGALSPPSRRRGRRQAARPASRSSAASRSQLHSTTARRVRCRGMAVRLPPVSSRKRSESRTAISAIGITRSRAAANSMASGSPSSRRTISVTSTTVLSSTAKPALTACARSTSRRTAWMVERLPRRSPPPAAVRAAAAGTAPRRRCRAVPGWWRRSADPGSWPAADRSARRPARSGAHSCRPAADNRSRPARRAAGRSSLPGRTFHPPFNRPGVQQTERAEHRLRDGRLVGDRSQFDQPHPVGPPRRSTAARSRWPAWSFRRRPGRQR